MDYIGNREEEMAFIQISTEVETWTERERDPEDEWDAGDTGGRVSNVTAWILHDAFEERGHYHNDSIVRELPVEAGDKIYAVVADYSSGNTFGRDGGYAQVLNAFASMDDALALQARALETRSDDRWREDYDYDFTFNGHEYRRAWAGYFEQLNSLDIWELIVQSRAVNYLNPGPEARIKRGR